MKKIKSFPISFLAYMVKSGYSFKHFGISAKTLEDAKVYDETETTAKRAKREGGILAKFKALLPAKPTDLQIREFILKYYHDHNKPFNYEIMKGQYQHLRFHFKLAPKSEFLNMFNS